MGAGSAEGATGVAGAGRGDAGDSGAGFDAACSKGSPNCTGDRINQD
jgi:hypothetical protein